MPCPLGRKKCPYNHDLEYKRPSAINQKQILCKYFAGQGCNLNETQCKFSHSLELLSAMDNNKHGGFEGPQQTWPSRSATGANQIPLGGADSFNDSEGTNHLINQRFRKVNQGANNNMSVVHDMHLITP